MFSKKAQGISFSYIVIAAVAAIVLIIIVAFTTTGFSPLRTIAGAGPTELESAKTNCRSYCNILQSTAGSGEDFESSRYCTETFTLDINGDRKYADVADDTATADVDESLQEVGLHCWTGDVGVTCSTAIDDVPYTETNCESYS